MFAQGVNVCSIFKCPFPTRRRVDSCGADGPAQRIWECSRSCCCYLPPSKIVVCAAQFSTLPASLFGTQVSNGGEVSGGWPPTKWIRRDKASLGGGGMVTSKRVKCGRSATDRLLANSNTILLTTMCVPQRIVSGVTVLIQLPMDLCGSTNKWLMHLCTVLYNWLSRLC